MKRIHALRRTALTLIAAAGLLLIGAAQPAVAGDITDENLADKVASATTPADHEALAAYFRGVAEENGKKVTYHEKMMQRLSVVTRKPSVQWNGHCRSLIAAYTSAQKEAEGLAQEHERLAKEAAE